jgi:hypothetical protein
MIIRLRLIRYFPSKDIPSYTNAGKVSGFLSEFRAETPLRLLGITLKAVAFLLLLVTVNYLITIPPRCPKVQDSKARLPSSPVRPLFPTVPL